MNNFDFVCFNNKCYITGLLKVDENKKTEQRKRVSNLLTTNKKAYYKWDQASRFVPIFGNQKNDIDPLLLMDLKQIVEVCCPKNLSEKSINIIIAHYFNHQHKNIPGEIRITLPDLKKQTAVIYQKFKLNDFKLILKNIFKKQPQLYFPKGNSPENPLLT